MTYSQLKVFSYLKLRQLMLASFTLVVAASCGKDPKTFAPSQEDTFVYDNMDAYQTASQLLQADYLFMLDPSYSTIGNVAQLRSSIKTFTQELRNEGIDYRVGFVNGNVQSTYSGATYKQSKLPSNFLVGLLSPSASIATEDLILSNLAFPLAENEPWHLEAADKILNVQGTSFLRSAAQLVYVFVSDSDDMSNQLSGDRSPTAYANKFKSRKVDPAYVSARAVIYSSSIGCNAPGVYGSSNATRIEAAAKATDHAGSNVVSCITSNFSNTLTNLARNVTRPTDRFVLQTRIVPGSLNIGVAGVSVDESAYTYNASTNEVEFKDGHVPGYNESVVFRFDPVITLSQTPNPQTIAVTVNGVSVPQSQTNGFVYVAGENRIVLTGPAAVNNAQVKVTYTIAAY